MLLSDICLSRTSGLTREQGPRKTKIGTEEVAHVTRDSDTTFRSKGQGHQATLLSAALTREAGAAVTVGMYWAWKLPLRCICGVREALRRPRGRRGAGHIVSPRAQLVIIIF